MIRKHPTAWGVYNNRAVAWREKGELDNALRDYSESIRLKPTYESFNNRGQLWLQKGELENAISDYTEAIRMNPTRAFAYTGRGVAWCDRGDMHQALRDLGEAIRLDPRDISARLNRGDVYIKRGDFERALQDYQAALQLDASSAAARGKLARLRAGWPEAEYRDGQQAHRDATKACELTGWKKPFAYLSPGGCMCRVGPLRRGPQVAVPGLAAGLGRSGL